MTSTAKKTPGDCETMAELRAEIDALDKELVSLLALRSDFIDRAVTLKTRENLPPRIPGRVAEVIANVRASAGERGLDPDLAESLWSVLIEWAIARETEAMKP